MALVNIVNVVVSFLLSGVDFAVASKDETGAVVRRVLIANPLDLDMGVAGIALGTTIAWTLGCIVMVYVCARGVHGVRLRLKRLRPHWHTVRRLVRIGLPNFSETLGMWAGNFITVLMVGWMRDPGILGAHVIAIRIEAFSFLPGFAISLAAATLVGTYLGASRPDLARRAALRCLWIACALMGSCGLVFILAPTTIVGLLSQQPTHLRVVPEVLRVAGLVQAAFAVAIVIRSVLRGAGDTASAAWLTWISIWGIRLPLAWLCCGVDLPLPWGGVVTNPAPLQSMGVQPLVGFWIGLCGELLIRATLFVIVFARGKWMRARV
jgi:putative MATE family efflux protein